ncbi:MAG: TraR/DksA family transcriptional regulator [Thermoanaerobaculia bacterium]
MATKSASATKKAPAKSATKASVKAPSKAPARPAAKAAPKVAEKAAPKAVERAAKDPLEKHRKRLLAKQEELLHDLSRNRQVTDESVDEQAQDMVDRATSAYTREFAFSLSESDRRTLLLIDQALLRLDQGTYGTCVHCQGHVQEKRLEAVPWARHCLECQELQDKGLL